MSKYYKAEDAIRAIEEMENCYNGWSDTYDKAQIIGVLEELPTIEVSEDCISREDLRKSLTRPLRNNNTDERYWKGWHDCTVAVETRIADAPSVVPSCQKNRQVERAECEGCKHYVYQLGCTHHATCEYEPKVEE